MIKCKKCGKELANKRSLKYHQEKALPCDFGCDICDVQLNNRQAYYRHMEKIHPEEWTRRKGQRKPRKAKAGPDEKGKEEAYNPADPDSPSDEPNEIEELARVIPLKDRIPNNDFIFGTYTFSDSDKTIEQTTTLESATLSVDDSIFFGGGLVVDETIRRRTRITAWNEKAAREISHDILYDVVDFLDDYVKDVPGRSMELFKKVYACPEKPHLISMKATNDPSRKTTEFLTRNRDGIPLLRKCSPEMSLIQVRNMLPELIVFLLRVAIPKMHNVYIKPTDENDEGSYGLTIPHSTKEMFKVVQLITETDEEDEDYIRHSFTVFEISKRMAMISALNSPKYLKHKIIADKAGGQIRILFSGRLTRLLNSDIPLQILDIPDKELFTFFEVARDASLGIEH